MSNALVQYEEGKFEVMQRVAKALADSGYFPDAKAFSQAVVKVMAGAELGLAPFASMGGIHIIQGRPALGANVIATLIKNDPRYDYRVLELTDSVCRIQFFEAGQACGVSEFTAQDAKKAGTKNMDRYAKNMLFARAMSNGAKWFVPGVFGGAPVYTPEELGADVDGNGDIVEGVLVEDVKPKRQTVMATPIQPEEVQLTARDDYEMHISPGNPTPEPEFTDDEKAIYDASARDFFTVAATLIPRYDHPNAVKNAAKKLNFAKVPAAAHARVEMYRAIRDYAAQRDADEAGAEEEAGRVAPLFDTETVGGGAYAE